MILAVAFLLALSTQDADPGQVRKWISSLDSENAKVREEAEARLLQAGRPIRPLLSASLSGLTPEQKGRVESILQRFVLEDEDDFALKTLQKGDPFPLPPPAPGIRGEPFGVADGPTIAETVSLIARRFNLNIEFFAADTALVREVERTNVQGNATTSNGDVEFLLKYVLSGLDVCYVSDGKRVVIVRLTPPILLEFLAAQNDYYLELEQRLDSFGGGGNRHDVSIGSFLQARYNEGGPRLARWMDALKSIAQDSRRPVRDRRLALRGLRWFRGLDDQPQPEVAALLLALIADEKAPLDLRVEAGASLVYGIEDDAQEKLLELLEKGQAEWAKPVFFRMIVWGQGYLGALNGIQKHAERRARLIAALEKLERHPDRDLALRALCAHAMFALEGPAIQRLAKAEDPADPETFRIFLEALRGAAFGKHPEIWDRVDRLASHPTPRIRAAAGQIYGRSVGGTERIRDAKGALALLADKEPLVRWAAAEALDYIYMIQGAAEPYDEGWDAAEPPLQKALSVETHPKVKESLDRALQRR
ncbi:MAG TPA: hypothetical protein VNM14_08720 [Planctomycetota bacterium]|nr:hypothetical protein [Planctomycetota bacterium]